ncbi:MAG: wax ester/triacylglycerol synthase family O-acyltransferase [Solirubrobacterales bacterium]
MNEQLSPLDATFLELEEADPSAHMHIGAVILFEGQPGGGPPSLERIQEQVLGRLPSMPRFTERLSEPETGGIRWPAWEPDPGFRVEHHVTGYGLPSPGGRDELLDWAGEYYSQRLDRTRPLWELAVVERGDGGWALVTKTHHCMVDGVASVDIGTTLLDTRPDAPDRSLPLDVGFPTNGRGDFGGGAAMRLTRPARAAARGAGDLGRAGLHATRSALGLARHPSRARESLHRAGALAELVVKDELIAAPASSLNQPIGAKRRLGIFQAPLSELRAIKLALGGTVNDVVLAIATGGLRRLLLYRDEKPPPAGLRAMVPVNVRNAAESLALGNRISSLFVHLPVAEPDPGRRYERAIEEAEGLKAGSQAVGSAALLGLAGHMPPVLHSFIAQAIYATRLFNVTITNVPGPQEPLYCLGSRAVELWPLVPLAAEHAVGLAVFSYDGTLHFCVNADRDSVEDLHVLIAGMTSSLQELRDLARAPVG